MPDAPPVDKPITPDANAPALFSTIIPEEYREKPYLKDFLTKPVGAESYKELFKKLDGAETLIGKRAPGIPAADAPESEWEAHFAKMRPAKADDYEFKVGESADPEFIKTVREAFYEGGATKGQASKILGKIQAAIEAQGAKHAETQAALHAEFDALTKATFGAENEKALATTKAMLKEFVPKNLEAHIDKLDNTALVILSGVLNGVHTKFGLEDKLTPEGGGNNSGADVNALLDEGRKLQGSEEFTNSFHPKHAETVARVNALYKEIAARRK